jgi:hypothetical protein
VFNYQAGYRPALSDATFPEFGMIVKPTGCGFA